MDESVKISKEAAELKSMRYEELREIAVSHIQELAGKLWTDFNTHDPGVTLLEVLCYAITDLGNRSNQKIEDILAADPAKPDQKDIKNFFTAAEILPGKPLTLTDIRKLIIDVSVKEESEEGCSYTGVKNAWISVSKSPEVPVWAHISKSKLSYEPKVDVDEGKGLLEILALYDILLEFETCKTHGDLNRNIIRGDFSSGSFNFPGQQQVDGSLEIEFARWDDSSVDWNDTAGIRKTAGRISVSFRKLPAGYSVDYTADQDKQVSLKVTDSDNNEFELVSASDELNNEIDKLTKAYQGRVQKVHEIVKKVKSRLHANRNLCEDFLNFSALKVEGVAVCADIELELEADVEEIQAQIYHQIAGFLAPPVRFYSLGEMTDLGIPTEEIFEGPLMEHGFMPDSELQKSDRMRRIYVSDLINIIMEIDGVVSVRHIEIANIPDGTDDDIESKSVKWWLDIAYEKNYVPRLSVRDSKITFFKEQLPYQANQSNVKNRLSELESEDESGKLPDQANDVKSPKGKYLNLDSYTSIKEDLPLVYGVGFDGLPTAAGAVRKAQANQLKGYLLFFEQLLANYLAQLAHVKDLYSMNAGKDEHGSYKVDRTYFTKSVTDLYPEIETLFKDPDKYQDNLDMIAESEELFIKRRNKFMDHLMARFAEQFTDYATLTYRMSGMEGKRDLLQDKLAFLNSYPEISSGRGTAFNYKDPCRLWHIGNKSGLERRASLQIGIDDTPAERLNFSDLFVISESGSRFSFHIRNSNDDVLLAQPEGTGFGSAADAAEALEELIIAGLQSGNYEIIENDATFSFSLSCDGTVIAESFVKDYGTREDAEAAIAELTEVFESEFYTNPESNRNNFAAPVNRYFDIKTEQNGTSYTVSYTLYSVNSFGDAQNALLNGSLTGTAVTEEEAASEMDTRSEEFIWDVVINGGEKERYLFLDDGEGKGRVQLTGRSGQVLGESPGELEDYQAYIQKLTEFFHDKFLSNEGLHLIEHILLRPRVNNETLQDPLFPLYIDQDIAGCQLSNPYSYIATVVLPYWQGRFGSMDFRRFFERKIRLEAPAHIFLRICWVSNRQMTELETSYRKWLLLNACNDRDEAAISEALGDLISVLDGLSNVYPVGRLHDCEAYDTLEEAMILNNSTLGSN